MRCNRQIRSLRVRLVGEHGQQFGVMTLDEAITRARSRCLDVVEVEPNAEPPVCRLLDYGRFCFGLSKQRGRDQ